MKSSNGETTSRPTNEYVLNVAFFSFLGFVIVQTIFALIAHSESMLADSEAMAVDSLTYLFNLLAERIKKRPSTEAELKLTPDIRAYRRELQRLYLELITPALSVSTLIVITIMTLQEAIGTLKADSVSSDDDVSVPIMLIFSGGNLLLDIVNVMCFSRADSTFGLDVVRRESQVIRKSWTMTASEAEEISKLVEDDTENPNETDYGSIYAVRKESNDDLPPVLVNLNMCSAWTHVCADTLRSIAVLLAAGIATIFPSIRGDIADAVAAITVSIIILISLIPLLQGLILTGLQIHRMHRNPK